MASRIKASIRMKAITFQPATTQIRVNGKETIAVLKNNPLLFRLERESSRFCYFMFNGTFSRAEELIKKAWDKANALDIIEQLEKKGGE